MPTLRLIGRIRAVLRCGVPRVTVRAVGVAAALWSCAALAQATVAPVTTVSPPTARRSTGLAEDPVSGLLYAFGGFLGAGSVDNTLYALVVGPLVWTPTVVAGGGPLPTARESHGLGVDPQGRVVVYGGLGSTGLGLDDVWIYDPGTQEWTGPLQPTTRPSARAMLAFHYAPQRAGFLAFGGTSAAILGTRNNQLWHLDVADGGATWQQLTPTGTAPSIRDAMCTGYDADAGRLYVFGGEAGPGGNNVADTFRYDVGTNAWSNDNPTGTIPSARSFAQCAWDPTAGRLLLYGGQQNNPIGGAFTYDPVAKVWADVTPTSNPGTLSDGSAAHHSAFPGMFFFGGRTANTTYTSGTVWMFLGDAGLGDAGVDAGTDAGTGPGADAGVDAGTDAGTGPGEDAGTGPGEDAGTGPGEDAGTGPGEDAGTGPGEDAGVTGDAGTGGGAGPRPLSVGCGCSAGSGSMAGLLLALGALLRKRRRAPQGASTSARSSRCTASSSPR